MRMLAALVKRRRSWGQLVSWSPAYIGWWVEIDGGRLNGVAIRVVDSPHIPLLNLINRAILTNFVATGRRPLYHQPIGNLAGYISSGRRHAATLRRQ